MGRPRKIKSPEEMAELWEQYKFDCNHRKIVKTEFSARLGEFITKEIPASVTYTVIGFCSFVGMNQCVFYETYKPDPAYSSIVRTIEQECEVDVREKFEVGAIPTNLAALWMSKHGYSTKNEQEIKGNIPVVINGEDDVSE